MSHVHTCHWPGCGAPVPPKLWGCRAHWFRIPKPLRDRIWATYSTGQEVTKTPSPAYLAAAHDVQAWIATLQAQEIVSMLPALSIRQPWAWFIVHGFKPVENRDWPTKLRGRFLVHASLGMTRGEWVDAIDTAKRCGVPADRIQQLAQLDQLQRGGIVGAVDLVDCVTDHPSPWFFGKYGFVLQNARPLPFVPWKGRLGFFQVPESVVQP